MNSKKRFIAIILLFTVASTLPSWDFLKTEADP